jgi:RimJ/RimL family protein N-acetyltransferase
MRIRQITAADAESYLRLCQSLDGETSYMLYEPGERIATVLEQVQWIQSILSRNNQMVFVAESEQKLVGHLQVMGGQLRRNRNTIYVVVGVMQEAIGKGIGTGLLKSLEQWATAIGAHRLELTVMTHNERAVSLYRKIGFEFEGIARETLYVGGSYVNEYLMAKLLQRVDTL